MSSVVRSEVDGAVMEKVKGMYESLRGIRPVGRAGLRNYVKVFLGIDVPDRKVCSEHNSPMDYLWHAFNSDFTNRGNGDCVVWANRGGGKTELAAAATLLDCVFKAGCSVRILGGSLEQSSRMYEYFTDFVYNGFEHLLAEKMLKSVVWRMGAPARSVKSRYDCRALPSQ